MRVRSSLIAAAAIAGTLTVAAEAAPIPKSCNLVVDPAGDDGGTLPHNDSLDVLSADIASDAKSVTAVIKVAKLTATDNNAPSGRAWYFAFNVPGAATPIYLGATVTPTATNFAYGWVDGSINRSLGSATGKLDLAKNEIRVTAPIAAWGDRGAVKPKSKVTGLRTTSYYFVGAIAPVPATPVTAANPGGGSLQPGDEALSAKTYIAAAPSCVVVGQ